MSATRQNIMVLVAASTVNTGPVKGILQFIQYLREPEINYHLYNFWQHNNPIPDPFEMETLKVGIPCNFVRMGRHNYFLMILDAIRSVKSKRITIIQTHGFKPSLIGLCVKYLCGIKWICFMHGTTAENRKVRLYNHIDAVMQQFADHVVLVSGNQRSKIPGGLNEQRVTVIHNAVNIHQPVRISDRMDSTRSRLQVSDDSILIAVVGRLSPEKGIDVFIKAFSLAAEENGSISAVIVGDGQERASLVTLAKDLSCAERIRFVGHTATPGDYMTAADIIVLPSRSEGIPNVALEAMALGKPVIATAVGGTPEVVEHEMSGLLVPSDQPEVLAQSILRVINEPGLAQKLSQGALKRVKENFSVDIRCKKLVNIYRSL